MWSRRKRGSRLIFSELYTRRSGLARPRGARTLGNFVSIVRNNLKKNRKFLSYHRAIEGNEADFFLIWRLTSGKESGRTDVWRRQPASRARSARSFRDPAIVVGCREFIVRWESCSANVTPTKGWNSRCGTFRELTYRRGQGGREQSFLVGGIPVLEAALSISPTSRIHSSLTTPRTWHENVTRRFSCQTSESFFLSACPSRKINEPRRTLHFSLRTIFSSNEDSLILLILSAPF